MPALVPAGELGLWVEAEVMDGGMSELQNSGYCLGCEAVRCSLERMNQGSSSDTLTRNLLTGFDLDHPEQLIALFRSDVTGRRYWAQHARLVVDVADAGPGPVRRCWPAPGRTQSRPGVPRPAVFGGGLGMHSTRLQAVFRDALAADDSV